MVDRLCTSLAGLSLSAIRLYTALAAEREDCITLTIPPYTNEQRRTGGVYTGLALFEELKITINKEV